MLSRFAVETHTVALLLERTTTDLDADEFEDLIARFVILHDVFCPLPTAPSTTED